MRTRFPFVITISFIILAASLECSGSAVAASPRRLITAGDNYTLILKPDRTGWGSGSNSLGQLGDGSGEDRLEPARIAGLEGIIWLSAGQNHAAAVLEDGTVWTWGSNSNGQLGVDIENDRSLIPVQVRGPGGEPFLTGISAVACGGNFTLALAGDGTVWSWGQNHNGQLGDGSFRERRSPVQVQGLENVTVIGAGNSHSVAMTGDGTVMTWGGNAYGQLGDGEFHARNLPGDEPVFENALMFSAGRDHTVVLRDDGTVWAWGRNNHGQLGDVTRTNRRAPVQVFAGASGGSRLEDVTFIGSGYWHSFAIKDGGSVWAWGRNDYGQLGDGTSTDWTIPFPVLAGESDDNGGYFQGADSVTGGGGHSLIMKIDGTVWAWGLNEHGQLADGTDSNSPAPVRSLFDLTLFDHVDPSPPAEQEPVDGPGSGPVTGNGQENSGRDTGENQKKELPSSNRAATTEKYLPLSILPPAGIFIVGFLAVSAGAVFLFTLGRIYYYRNK